MVEFDRRAVAGVALVLAVAVAHADDLPRLPESLMAALPGVGDLVVYPRSGEVHVCRRIPARASAGCASARQVIDGALAHRDAWLAGTADLLYPTDPDIAVLDRAIALAADGADGLFVVAYRMARHHADGAPSRSRTLVVTRCAPSREADLGSSAGSGPTALCSEAEYCIEPTGEARAAHARDGAGRLAVATTAHGLAILLPDGRALFTAQAVDPLAWSAAHIRHHPQPVFAPASADEDGLDAHAAVFRLHPSAIDDVLIVTREIAAVDGPTLVSLGALPADPSDPTPMLRLAETRLFDRAQGLRP
ncbi:hypothetical protein [Thiocapsa marina]|uniref:Uncharacterized protein n=1 Tax=Thiocapsa marina 5811 TaxID=768671 RepID=F9UHS0_9GAMM|nr:hypothetical protein [Thiocapsa marina]EGV16246.1 hypothetical protein ThimaDRAFT_4473 [Thiocapsa marina 5811]